MRDPPRARLRALVGLVCAFLLATAPGCGGDGDEPAPEAPPPAPPLVTRAIGSGPETTTIVRPAGTRPLPVVLFLHGWGGIDLATYRPWVEHLASAGNVVLYPRYQESVLDPPAQVLGNVLTGVRRALRAVPTQPGTLVVAGHSAGGALAADYAGVAASVGLPVPRAVYSAYPGRRLRGFPFSIPEVDPRRIAPATHVEAIAGARDATVGTAPARRLFRGAIRVPRARRLFRLVRDPRVSDHLGPQRADAVSRRTFWAPLDALIRRARAR